MASPSRGEWDRTTAASPDFRNKAAARKRSEEPRSAQSICQVGRAKSDTIILDGDLKLLLLPWAQRHTNVLCRSDECLFDQRPDSTDRRVERRRRAIRVMSHSEHDRMLGGAPDKHHLATPRHASGLGHPQRVGIPIVAPSVTLELA